MEIPLYQRFCLLALLNEAGAADSWRVKRRKRNTAEMSSSSTSLALVRLYSSTGSTNRNTEILSVNSLSRDILINFPHSIAMQKQILVNLRTVEYKLERWNVY
ncbi:kita-kyushu lung cancer antigen 1 isoform X1 [Equus przewalskii]|uniref:Kita-kyushu lung cancer antigen 1 isoform X1 n=1 Tax=Equus przewalskii TaxID=9798 RepID=A0ABM2EVU4_EQUPR|nr:PREDICTED: kita-kyushu lung cancer antigen 1 isoform X1 [Equus przewalskii]XP_014584716.1 kita-kyushu lung cancer antigen 1 isoform X1 [Equus caballus]